MLKAGSYAAEGCESRQVRKEAAVSGDFRVSWVCLARASSRRYALGEDRIGGARPFFFSGPFTSPSRPASGSRHCHSEECSDEESRVVRPSSRSFRFINRPRFFVEFITSMHSVQALSGAEGLQNDILSMAEPLTGTIKSAWQ